MLSGDKSLGYHLSPSGLGLPRLQRAARSQNAAFEALYEKHSAGPPTLSLAPEGSTDLDPGTPADSNLTLGRMLVKDFAQEKVLERLLLYERRIESSLYRTMAELRRLRREREAGGEGKEVSSLKLESRAWNPPVPNFTLPTSDEPPYGVTANGTDTKGQSCETKPIGPGPELLSAEESVGQAPPYTEEVGRGRPTYEEPPSSITTNGPAAEARRAEQTNFARLRCRPSSLWHRGYGRFGSRRAWREQSQFPGARGV